MAGLPPWLRRVKRCQYGIPGLSECGAFSTTKRKRPSGRRTWDVCDQHADALDRLRHNIVKHHDLLERLKHG